MHAIQTSGNTIRMSPQTISRERHWTKLRIRDLCRVDSSVVNGSSGVPVLAPQVQDCDQWRRIRPGGDSRPRYRSATRAGDGGRGVRYLRRRRAGADASGGHPSVRAGGGCDLLPHLEAIVSVYNLHGRRDNKYKARIKILLQVWDRRF